MTRLPYYIKFCNTYYRCAGITLDEIKERFDALARQQRGAPESAMLRYQEYAGTGFMPFLVEHVGDLIHRMSERVTFAWGGYESVHPKVEWTLNKVKDPSAAEKRFQRSLEDSAAYDGIPLEEFTDRSYELLDKYAVEHAKLPTYNEVQRLAQQAAVALGKRDFWKCRDALQKLSEYLVSPEVWAEATHEYDAESSPQQTPLLRSTEKVLNRVVKEMASIKQNATLMDLIVKDEPYATFMLPEVNDRLVPAEKHLQNFAKALHLTVPPVAPAEVALTASEEQLDQLYTDAAYSIFQSVEVIHSKLAEMNVVMRTTKNIVDSWTTERAEHLFPAIFAFDGFKDILRRKFNVR